MSYDITQADILDWAAAYDGPLFHALICDPPYELQFMGRKWDSSGISFRPETWAALGRLLHPGAFIMAFAGTRGYHRMACAIEDAGFIIHPAVGWAMGSGFPKATRIDVQIDRDAGAERPIVGSRKQGGAKFKLTQELIDNGGFNDPDRDEYDVTEPASELSRAWAGHRYGLQALKPAFEFICVAQKPYQGRPVESITRTGAGAINIDAARIATDEDTARRAVPVNGSTPFGAGSLMGGTGHEDGRWPSNLVLSHSFDCNGECAPGCPVAVLGAQSGESVSSGGGMHPTSKFLHQGRAGDWSSDPNPDGYGLGDSGTAARYFFQADYVAERLEASDPLLYFPKSSTSEREAGLMDFDPMTVDDGRQTPIDNPYQRGETSRRNTGPCVKPIALTRHLATLLLPPDLYAPRRLLVPFCGTGSEAIGGILAGWEVVQGIDFTEEYVQIARARLAFWRQMRYKLMDPDAPVKVSVSKTPAGQIDMFESEAA